jgi:hypothetical protein
VGDTADRMEVAFDADARDLYRVLIAALGRCPAATRARLLEYVVVAAAAAVVFARAASDGWTDAAGYSALTAAIAAGAFAVRRVASRRGLWAYCLARAGPTGRFRVEVAVGPFGVRVRSLGDDFTVGWGDVTAVAAAGEPVDIWVRGHDLIRVQARAFGSGMDREVFVALVERYAGEAPTA